MLRKAFILCTVTIAGLTALSAHANPQRGKRSPFRIMLKELDLSSEQQDMIKAVAEGKKEFHQEEKESFQGSREQWMKDYLETKIDINTIHDQLDDAQKRHRTHHKEMITALTQFLDTLSEDQKSQMQSNLDMIEERMAKKESRMERGKEQKNRVKEERKGPSDQKKGRKHRPPNMEKVLLNDITLDDPQTAILSDLKEVVGKLKEMKKDSMFDMPSMIDDYLDGEIRRRGMIREAGKNLNEAGELKYEATNLWIELLASFSAEQKTQFVSNVDQHEKKASKPREQREEYGKPKKLP
jgi:hypothetical protein